MIFKSQIVNGRIRLSSGQRWVSYACNADAWKAAKAYNEVHGGKASSGAAIARRLEAAKASFKEEAGHRHEPLTPAQHHEERMAFAEECDNDGEE